MIIPENINFIQFYWNAKAKGVKIRSRYKGVYVGRHGVKYKDIVWAAIIREKRKTINIANFPFTAEGEKRASEAYQRFIKTKGNDTIR